MPEKQLQSALLGAHMSIEGGVYRALERGHSIGCLTVQLFTKNSSRWLCKELALEDIKTFRTIRGTTAMDPVFAHGSYLINLASCGELYKKSIDSMIIEVQRAEQLGLDFVVTHPGAHVGIGEEAGLHRIVDALNSVMEATSGARCKIAIENTAGQGSSIGHSIEHLAFILRHVSEPNRIGFCLDTCHLFAAGYDLRRSRRYYDTFAKLCDQIPPEKILAFHVNDSKKPLGSRVDRHEHIGKGYLGRTAFRLLLNDSRFARTPKILETPKGKDLAEDVANLKILRSLVG